MKSFNIPKAIYIYLSNLISFALQSLTVFYKDQLKVNSIYQNTQIKHNCTRES